MGSGLSFASGERLCSQSRNSHSYNSVDYEMISYRDKKKKSSRFATMCKRFIKARRHNRHHDYSKHVKELTSNWCISEIESLANEYECIAALKELSVMANLARSNGSFIIEDLTDLFQNKYCADVDLLYLDTVYPAHKAILSVRCAFFRDLLLDLKGARPKVEVHLKTQGVDNNLFSALLRYLYTGDFGMDQSSLHRLKPVLSQLALEFGPPNSLKHDLKTLFETGIHSDAVLAFSEGTDSHCYSPSNPSHQKHKLFNWKPHKNYTFPMPCHKAILAARSSFFRNLINRRLKNEAAIDKGDQFNKKTVILLDETVIPARFASILLSSIYLDNIDFNSHILQQQQLQQQNQELPNSPENNNEQLRVTGTCCNSKKFLFQHLTSVSVSLPSSTSHASNNPCSVPTSLSSSMFSSSPSSSASMFLEEAMELYHIARFLDFPSLAQSCESMVVEQLSIDNLLNILRWSNESHGSKWVYRQALQYLADEFLTFCASPSFYQLDKSYFTLILQSDFIQASELDLLSCIIKWGEFKLIKSIEEQEPNLLSNTAHSVSKKGIKRRDLNDNDLMLIISDLLMLIRVDHLVPRNHEVVLSAIRRGLLPPFQPSSNSLFYPSAMWLNGDMMVYPKPRLFMPFYEEVKNIIREYHARSEQQQVNITKSCYGNITGNKSNSLSNTIKGRDSGRRLCTPHTCTAVPDTLYMLDSELPRLHKCWSFSSSTVDIIAGTILVPDKKVVDAMQRREAELTAGRLLLKGCHRGSHYRSAVTHQIRLRVVREFGLPDSAVKVLKGSSLPAHLSPPDTSHPSPHLPRLNEMVSSPYPTPLKKHKHFCPQHTIHRFPIFSSKNRSCSCNNGHNNNDKANFNVSCCQNNHVTLRTAKNNNNNLFCNDDMSCSANCDDKVCCLATCRCPAHLPSGSSHLRSGVFFMNPNSFFRSSSSFSSVTPSHSCHFKCNCHHHQLHKDDDACTYVSTTAMPDIAMATTTTTDCSHSDLMALSDLDLGDGSSHSNNPSVFL